MLWRCFFCSYLCALRIKSTFTGLKLELKSWTKEKWGLQLLVLDQWLKGFTTSLFWRLGPVLFNIFQILSGCWLCDNEGEKINIFCCLCYKYLGVWLDQASWWNLCLNIDTLSVCWTLVYHSAFRHICFVLSISLQHVVFSHYYIFIYKVTLDKPPK